MLSTKEVAARLGINQRSVVQLIRRELLASTRLGRDHYVALVEVERYLAERRPAHRPKRHQTPPQSAEPAT